MMAMPYFMPGARRTKGLFMTDAHSKSRQQAEIAFGNVQKQFFAKDQAVAELQSIPQHRDDKTMRLREARSARELERQPAQRKSSTISEYR